jgi:hypothetical protein
MKKAILTLSILLLGASLQAQTITCSVSGASTKQASQYAAFLASLNVQRAAQNPPLAPFANFSEHCSSVMLSAFNSYLAQQTVVDATKVGTASTSHGDEIAPNAQCAAVSLANGCTKNQVACFVLTGNVTCQ